MATGASGIGTKLRALPFLSGTVWVLIPKGLGGLSLVLLNLIMVRRMEPAQFGVFAFCTTCVLLFYSLLGSALDFGVIRSVTEKGDAERSWTDCAHPAVLIKLAASSL